MSTSLSPELPTVELRSSATTIVPEPESELVPISPAPGKKRWFLLAVFCLAQFTDVYSGSGTVLAIPQISEKIHLTIPQSIWVISAYALAFAAMMLPAGRLADIWSAKYVFVIGLVWIGLFSLGLGFVNTANGLIVLRALQGVGAAMTIPSATNLIVHLFPEPKLQEIAISLFGATGAIANILGLVLGGLLLLADYTWIFYLITILCVPMAVVAFVFTPDSKHTVVVQVPVVNDLEKAAPSSVVAATVQVEQQPRMDYLGTFVMTAAIVLFVYGLTSANITGWKSATSLSTMLIGFCLFPVFYFVETLPKNEADALIPPSMWRIRNFGLLAGLSLTPAFWFFAVQSSLSERMQLFGATPLLVAARFMPMGVSAIVGVGLTQAIPFHVYPLRLRLIVGALLGSSAALMISFAPETMNYWALLFPAFILGPIGIATLFITLNVAIIMSVGPERSGVAGGVINSIFQLGVTIGLAITTTLQNSYRDPSSGMLEWRGYKYSFLFVMAVFIVCAVVAGTFFVDPLPSAQEDGALAPASASVEGRKGSGSCSDKAIKFESAEDKLERAAMA